MPLTPRFTWAQDAASVALEVALPGAALKNVDVYVSDLVVKVNAAPYVLLLDLFDSVDDASAVVKRNAATHVLHITINKAVPQQWGQLTLHASKATLKERRLASMERKRQAEASLAEKRKDRKYQEEKQTLRAQMAVDDTNRQILADLKAEEKAREEAAMYESFKTLQMKQQQAQQPKRPNATPSTARPSPSEDATKSVKTPKKRVSFADSRAEPANNQRIDQQAEEVLELTADGSFDIVRTAPPKLIWDDIVEEVSATDSEVDVEDIDSEDNQAEAKSEVTKPLAREDKPPQPDSSEVEVEVVELPPPRAPAEAEIQFTPRLFPTPSRESKAAEEEDWMLKNRKHLKKHKGLRGAAGAYDISESDPAWLKAKGDDFYRSRDYRSAVNAYSEAISAVDKDQNDLLTACLSNRAACHLQLGAFEKCLEDCTTALSHLPDTPAAAEDHARVIRDFRLKLKLLVRRGTALCRLGQYTEAKADYGVALTMDKQNAPLQHDYFQLLQLERSQQAKERGDACFRDGELDDAIAHYDESLQLHPHSIACLSNRAACYLRRRELQKCVDDCSTALQLLQQQPSDSTGENNAPGSTGIAFFAVGPAPGTAKRREWVVKTLVRRGTALVAMGSIRRAEQDYAAAAELDPLNAAIQSDLCKIREQLEGTQEEIHSKVPPAEAEAPVMAAP